MFEVFSFLFSFVKIVKNNRTADVTNTDRQTKGNEMTFSFKLTHIQLFCEEKREEEMSSWQVLSSHLKGIKIV
jgi:hypothetical protein